MPVRIFPLIMIACATLSASLASASGADEVRIGNYFVFAPNGIAFIVKDAAAFVIDPGGEYYAGPAAPDGSYHSSTFTIKDAKVTFEWGRVGDSVVGRFSSSSDVDLPVKLLQPWPNWQSNFTKSEYGWSGRAPALPKSEWKLHSMPALGGDHPDQLSLHITSEQPARLIAGLGMLPKLNSVDELLSRAKAKFEKTAPQATGDWNDFLAPIAFNLQNSRVYSNDDNRLAISVSRRWADSPNSEPYFCWDSFFNGALSSLADPSIARDTVRAILSCQTPEGMVPNFGHWNFAGGRASNDRSQPPVGALCVWKIQQRWPNRAFLAEIYPKLLKWHRWWPQLRDGRHDGLLEWGSTVTVPSAAGKQGALWETGWDDTVEYEGAVMEGSTLNAYAVDLNSLWAMDAEYLATIADQLGKAGDAKELRQEREKTLRLMNEKLWNPELGIYCSRLWSGEFLTRLTPMNFYPLIAGAANADQAKQIFSVIKDPARFWGTWILPTVAYNDPIWHQQDYWKGKVWAPVNYLVWQGLLRYADSETLQTFAGKSVELFMRNWESKRVCGENYLSSTGEQSSDPHYTWGALLCLIGLESICRMEADGTVVLDGTQTRTLNLDNIPLGGKMYSLRCVPGKVELLLKRKLVATAQGKVLKLRL